MRRSMWNWRRVAVAAGVGALTVGALASVGAAVSPKRTSAATTEYQPHKVMLCHHTHSTKNPFVTIIVAKKALPAHLRHGDTIGSCPQVASTQQTAKTKAKTKSSHAKSKGKHKGAVKKATTVTPAVTPAVQGATKSALRSSFDEVRGGNRKHEAIDILAPMNTPVFSLVVLVRSISLSSFDLATYSSTSARFSGAVSLASSGYRFWEASRVERPDRVRR